MMSSNDSQVIVVGGGFTGLSAAYELAKRGIRVTVLEGESEIGGLAAAFEVGGEKLERFYHHWFTSDQHVMRLIGELGVMDRVQINPTNTGLYYANTIFRLSTPVDLLRFSPLAFMDRIRLGLLALRARRVSDWMRLEGFTAREWLCGLAGQRVYSIVWEPLLKGKFGPYAEEISAVWFWNKLKLRGGSRGKAGQECLAYLVGGFVALAEMLADRIRAFGGAIETSARVLAVQPTERGWKVIASNGETTSDRVIVTTALPLIADMIQGWAGDEYMQRLTAIPYLSNVCLVLELDRPLSRTYWLNVNDPTFPFVGLIEHTNFQEPGRYAGKHIVYLSKYLPHTDPLYSLRGDEFLQYALPYLQMMFPSMRREWVRRHHLWRARWAQPVVGRYYSRCIPPVDGPLPGFHVCSMAQIYPEDRGTNYAIREGRNLGARLAGVM